MLVVDRKQTSSSALKIIPFVFPCLVRHAVVPLTVQSSSVPSVTTANLNHTTRTHAHSRFLYQLHES